MANSDFTPGLYLPKCKKVLCEDQTSPYLLQPSLNNVETRRRPQQQASVIPKHSIT